MEVYDGQLKSYAFNIRKERKNHAKQKDGTYKYIYYNDSIITFDIETTSAYLENGKVIPYTKGKSADYWNSLQPLALCYIWQCSVDGTVYYGRELSEFVKLLDDLPKNTRTVIWVHNLSWEFHFLENVLTFSHLFARSPHKPIYAMPAGYDQNIEFRCSYMLTRLSLDSWGKQIGLPKATGDLNYDLIRTPLTELSAQEMNYCERDCLVVEAGIKDYLRRYKDQWDIPLTQTGTVRRPVKNMLTSDDQYMREVKKTVPRNSLEYDRAQRASAGGYTHTNRLFSGLVIREEGEHYDYNSKYPFEMAARKYPWTPWIYSPKKVIPDEKTFDEFAYIMLLKFTGLECQTYNTYIQVSKCISKDFSGFVCDNGRLVSCEGELEIYVTEQDWLTIRDTYKWDKLEVERVWKSRKRYLPKEFIHFILDLYEKKTALKGVDGMEDLYLQSKQYINAMFGCMLTSIVQADIEYKDGIWTVGHLTKEVVEEKLDALRKPYKYERRYFLNYWWGIYVTAYARRDLWTCILKYDRDVLYGDTDSLFIRGHADFTDYNEWNMEMLKASALANDFDLSKAMPKDKNGVTWTLGEFSKEPDFIEFKALGAKRYIERRRDGKLYLTVAGINKGAVECLDDDIDNFAKDFEFDKDHDAVKKKLLTYVYDQPDVVWPDGYISTCRRGINLRRTGYKLTIPDEYEKLLKLTQMSVDDLPEQLIIQARGRWSK